ncbi:hypothetical protein BLOT_013321 [Blomia tropicalis]|nr:hypothetical protein BLOT_013321 [Blomia tropicalis]
MDLLVKQYIPYQTIAYMTNYLEIINKHGEPNYLLTIWKKFSPIYMVALLKSIHFGWLYLYPRTNIEEQFFHFDLVSVSQLPRELNVMFIGVLAYSSHFLYLLYFCDFTKLNQILYQIFVLRSTSGILRLPKMNSKRFVWQEVILISMTFLKGCQPLLFVEDTLIIAINIQFISLLYANDSQLFFTFYGWYKLLMAEFNIILFALSMNVFVYPNILHGIHEIATFWVLFRKMQQSLQLIVTKWTIRKLKLYKPNFTLFIREHIQTLQMMMHANEMFSISLSTFMLVHNPLNCLLVTTLILKDLSFYIRMYVMTFVLVQFYANFGIHLMVSKINNKFNKSGKIFVQKWGGNCQSSVNVRQKIRADCFISAFYTKNKYGITYL